MLNKFSLNLFIGKRRNCFLNTILLHLSCLQSFYLHSLLLLVEKVVEAILLGERNELQIDLGVLHFVDYFELSKLL